MPIDDADPTDDAAPGGGVDDGADAAALDDVEQLDAQHLDEADELIVEPELTGDAALVARAKQRYGVAGAMLAGGMLGLDRLLTGKVKQDAPVEWEAPGEPLDIDRKGIDVPLEDERIVRSRPGPAAAAGATSRRVTRRRRT